MLGGGALLLVASAPAEDWGQAAWSAQAIGSIAYLAVIGSAVPFVTLTILLRELPAVTVSYITLLLPFGALAFGAALYDEHVTLAAIGGALLVATRSADRPVALAGSPYPPDRTRGHAPLPQPAPLRRAAVRPHRVASRGTDRQRDWALRTLNADATIRHARSVNAKARGRKGTREGHDALAAAAAPRPQPDHLGRREHVGGHRLKRVRDEDDGPTGDPAVDEAFDGFGATWDFWQQVFSRDSIDDENMPLRGVVHFGEEYPNAFWDGRRMAFGDGDGELFLRFTKSLDVIAHELGHGVIEDEAALEYHGQSGALNEHFADVAGTWSSSASSARRPTQADWLIGAELRGDEFDGDALRSMKAPGTAYDDAVLGKDPQPAHWRRLRAHVRGQRRRAHQLGDPEQGVLPARHEPRRQLLARARAASGTTPCAARCSPPPRPSASSPASPTAPRAQRFGPGSDEMKAVREAWAEVGVSWE